MQSKGLGQTRFIDEMAVRFFPLSQKHFLHGWLNFTPKCQTHILESWLYRGEMISCLLSKSTLLLYYFIILRKFSTQKNCLLLTILRNITSHYDKSICFYWIYFLEKLVNIHKKIQYVELVEVRFIFLKKIVDNTI